MKLFKFQPDRSTKIAFSGYVSICLNERESV